SGIARSFFVKKFLEKVVNRILYVTSQRRCHFAIHVVVRLEGVAHQLRSRRRCLSQRAQDTPFSSPANQFITSPTGKLLPKVKQLFPAHGNSLINYIALRDRQSAQPTVIASLINLLA